MGKRIVVITGGECTTERSDLTAVMPYDLVIAADSGLDRSLALGVQPDVLVGDLDSASRQALDIARHGLSEIEAHAPAKDQTDLELALRRAVGEGATEIVVFGGGGGRADHWLANLAVMAATARRGVSVRGQMGGCSVRAVVPGDPYVEELRQGELVSLLPMGGDARGVVTEGLAYRLEGDDLKWGGSRGVSNVACGGEARVQIDGGVLLVICPGGDEAWL